MTQIKNWWALKKAMWKWEWWSAPHPGDPRWGEGPQKWKNIDIASDRHDEQKPDCIGFGLEHHYAADEEHCRRCYCKRARL